MRLAKTDVVCELTAPTGRELMRSMQQRENDLADVAETLQRSEPDAEKILRDLEAEGYVKTQLDHGETQWLTTIKGNALAQALFGPPISRAKADALLQELISRARTYNADPTRLLAVVEIRVFGSYMNPEQQELGDLDIALSYAVRNNETFWNEMMEQARTEGNARTLQQEITYPSRNLFMRLKNRSPKIKITSEDITLFTESWRTVYTLADDPDAIQLTASSKMERGA